MSGLEEQTNYIVSAIIVVLGALAAVLTAAGKIKWFGSPKPSAGASLYRLENVEKEYESLKRDLEEVKDALSEAIGLLNEARTAVGRYDERTQGLITRIDRLERQVDSLSSRFRR